MTAVAVVTGAARGIGAAVARALAEDGWSLALGDLCDDDPASAYRLGTWKELQATAGTCRSAGVQVTALRCDVRRSEDVGALVAAGAALGPVRAGVPVAGALCASGPAWELSDAGLAAELAVNLGGVVSVARAVVPHLLQHGQHGRFVAVVSAAGERGLPLLAGYVAAKHAALGYVRSLAADLAPSGVTANAVLPGSTATPLLEATAAVYGLSSGQDLARHARLGRLLAPEEVAAAVAWLVSSAASGVTGTALPVDAGFTG